MIAQLLRALACLVLYLVCPSVITSAAALEGGDNGVCEAGEGMMDGGSAEALLCVPQVLVVNLARRADKWRSVSARLRAAGFRFENGRAPCSDRAMGASLRSMLGRVGQL